MGQAGRRRGLRVGGKGKEDTRKGVSGTGEGEGKETGEEDGTGRAKGWELRGGGEGRERDVGEGIRM